ncbi:hypothetical protein [Streptomyces sp. NPDC086782]|uniref:hypothetical protein n=1 Tax=Streptomyces sp. NPDC086782 TaxID=3365757 RepID=UPI0037F97947
MVTDYPKTAAEYRQQAKEQAQREAFQRNILKLGAALLLLPLLAFVLMLAVGAVHGFAPAVPAIGYGTTILLVMGAHALAVVTKRFRK